MKYRETLYAEYHRTQSGRFAKYNEELQFNLEKKIFTREIIPLLSDAAKDAQIFDVGCGTGSLLGALQANGFSEAQGMDISEDQLSVARRLACIMCEQEMH